MNICMDYANVVPNLFLYNFNFLQNRENILFKEIINVNICIISGS